MDVATKLLVARQSVLYVCLNRDDVVMYGSCAADRYVAPCMRFGELGHRQDMDLFLVVDDDYVHPTVLDEFVKAVGSCISQVSNVLDRALTWTVNMACNSLYTAHLHMQGVHFCDVTLVSKTCNARLQDRFPRKSCRVELPLLSKSGSLLIISLDEVLHRMAAIVASVPLVDDLPILPSTFNGAAIAKNATRLSRMKWLLSLGMVCFQPAEINFTHDCDVLLPTVSVDGAMMPAFFVSREPTLKDTFRSSVGVVLSKMSEFETDALKRLSGIRSRLTQVDARGKDLATALNARLRHENDLCKSVLSKASETLKTFRVSSFLSATKPIKAFKDIMNVTSEIGDVVEKLGCVNDVDPSLGDYFEQLSQISHDMAAKQYLPFSLFKTMEIKIPMKKKAEESENLYRDRCAVNSIKMNMMASFVVFLRMLHVSNGQLDESIISYDTSSFDTWTKSEKFLFFISRRIDALKTFVSPSEVCVPRIRREDGQLDFVVLEKDSFSKMPVDVVKSEVNKYLVPKLDNANFLFLMQMFDSLVGSITCPLIAHVDRLKEAMKVVYMTAGEVMTSCNEYIDDFSKNPFIAQVQHLKSVQDEIFSLCKVVSDKADVFTWGSKPSKRRQKKNKK